jgi:transcriptional regulator with XRE-family HTH domain
MDDLRKTIAANIRRLMELSEDCRAQPALAKRSGVSQRTISNMLRPEDHEIWPQLDNLQKIANCFGIETWRLLHPALGDKELSAKEIQMYRRWKEEIAQLQSQ